MKPIHGKNCSCTSCIFQTDSKRRPSVQKFIAEGSKIDKLYLGKYIPLREQKLLTKLVKTRAIYDDVRAEILSSSSIDARAGKPKADDDTGKSSAQAILDIVDFVDKGGVKAGKTLSNCCSCCICQPDGVHKHSGAQVHKHHRHSHHGGLAHVHPGPHRHHKAHRRGSVSSVTKTRKPAKGGRKPTRANIKSIKSVPCTCTYDISGMIKKKSKAVVKRMQAQKAIASIDTSHFEFYENSFERQGAKKAKDFAIKSYQKLKESEIRRGLEDTARKSMKKIKESKGIVKHKITVSTKRSMESLAEVSQKIKRASQRIKHKAVKLKQQVQTVPRERPSGLKSVPKDKFSIKKDSIAKFKEKLQQRNENEDLDQTYYEEREYREHKVSSKTSPTTSINLQAKETVQATGTGPSKRTKVQINTTTAADQEKSRQEKKIISSSTIDVQSGKNEREIDVVKIQKKRDIKERKSQKGIKERKSQKGRKVVKSSIKEKKLTEKKDTKPTKKISPAICECEVTTKDRSRPASVTSVGSQSLKASSSVSIETKMIKDKNIKQTQSATESTTNTKINVDKFIVKQDKHLHYKKDVSIDKISKVGVKKHKKDAQIGVHALKRCFCTLKLKPKKNRRSYSNMSVTKGTTSRTALKPSTESLQTAASESQDKPLKRDKRGLKRRSSSTGTTHQRKSISTLYTTEQSTPKIVQAHAAKKEKHTKTKHKLRRCFCILKFKPEKTQTTSNNSITSRSVTTQVSENLNKKRKIHHKLRPYECEPGICIPDECDPHECLKLIEKRNFQNASSNTEIRRTRKLRSYECEPGICIPDECDPYECLKLIEKRKFQTTFSSTDNRKTKSVSSITSHAMPPKVKRVQSSIVSYDTGESARKHKENLKAVKAPKDVRTTPNIPHRQAVRIGSTFSFSIEFYKDKPAFDNKPPPRYDSKPVAQPKKIKTVPREKKYIKEHGSQGDMQQETKSVTVQVEKHNKNALIGTVIKRCFCTLKLRKEQTKNLKEREEMTRGTMTPESKPKIEPVMVSRATKTKGKRYKYHDRVLEPYECEPNFCVPGECDPYECLERIKRRGHSRATSTEKVKRRSGSSNSEASVDIATSPVRVPYKEQTISANFRQPKNNATEQIEKLYIPKHPSSKEASRQAVKIGSTFSFDIEFYKDKNPEIIKSISPKPQKIKYTNDKKIKVKDIGARKEMYLSNQSSQFEDQRRKNKATGIKPILKRCFCTLQLLNKKDKRKERNTPSFLSRTTNVYTVSRLGKANFAAQNYLSHYQTNIFSNLSTETEINSRFKIESHYSQTNNQGSQNVSLLKDFIYINKLENADNNVSCDVKFFKEMKSSTDSQSTTDIKGLSNSIIKGIENDSDDKPFFDDSSSSESNLSVRHTQSKYINSFLRKCFYAMNMKTEKRHHKLKPYECEPGVCIPDECDPYECKKLIDQRSRASKRSGTEISSKSSSYNYPRTKTKNQKLKTSDTKKATRQQATRKEPAAKKNPAPVIQYKTAPRPKQRQAVRIGSSFSFDIEVFKEKSPVSLQSTPEPINREKKVKAVKTKPEKRKPEKQTQERDKRFDHSDQNTQSSSTKVDRGSSSSEPKLKRCFCTLKLQQSDKLVHEKRTKQKEKKVGNKKNKVDKEEKKAIAVSSSSTMTQPTKTKRKPEPYKLAPYECEPGFCIPGQCNPYECLEVIKKRNKGSEIKSIETRSDSSFTGVNKKKGKNVQSDSAGRKNRAVKVRQPKDRGNIAKAKEPKIIKQPARPPLAPERQVVRIGSSFSFNIEFYKSRSLRTEHIQHAARELKTKRKKQKVNTKKNKKRKTVKSLSSINASSESRESQTSPNTMSTKLTATKLKRCFCTLKLQKQRKIAEGERRKQKRQQHERASQATNTKPYKEEATMYTRSVNTKKKFKLKPYECEPNVCIPGECDPYECYERIQKRLREFGTGTDYRKTRSASSSIDTYSRTKRNQYGKRDKYHKKGTQAKFKSKQKKKKVSSVSSISAIKQPSEIIRPTQRQAVRIGSGFSFDIEFSKNRSLSVPRPVRSKPSKISPPKVKKKTGGSQDKSSFQTTYSQSEFGSNKRSTTTNTTQRLKRCFCTLSLKKQIDKNNPKYAFPRGSGRTKQVYRLEPYECEPNVCIPGECDPYECLERIKRRNRKEFGTSTGRQRISTGSSNTIGSSTRAKRIQKVYRRKQSDSSTTARQTVDKPKGAPNQAVKIGSSFKFNVEFYKDRSYGDHALVKSPSPVVKYVNKPPPAPTPVRVKAQRTQRSNDRSDADTQMSDSREHSTGINTILKRCFCTLKLLKRKPEERGTKPDKSPKPTNKGTNSDIDEIKVILPPKGRERATRTKKVTIQQLEPYECEPGFCIPGECDPYQCLERIRKRDMRSQKAGTARPLPISTASTASDPAQNRQTQAICTKPECRNKMAGNDAEKYIVEDRRFKPIENPFRQAVHISSSFSFSVEFYKDRVPGLPEPRVCPEGVCKTKPSSPITKHTKNVCTNDTCPNKNRKIQLDRSKMADRGSGKDAFLKRCFCTLKLQKERRKTTAHAQTHTGPYQPTNLCTCDVGVGKYKLEPYECEPNVCIPGECDPYECLERIRRRQMKSSAIGTGPTNRSATTLTSVGTKMCRDTQCYKDVRRCQNTQCVVRRPRKPIEAMPAPREYAPEPKRQRGRQTLKYGTTFGFDIELFKDDTIGKRKHKESTGITFNPRPKNVVDQGSYGRSGTQSRGNRCHPCTDSKASGIAPKLKRCFCTLKLMKGPYANEMKTVNYVSLHVKPPIANKKPNENEKLQKKCPTQQQNPSTKKISSRKAKDLKPYECAPIMGLEDLIKCDTCKSSKRKHINLCPPESIGIPYAYESQYLNTKTKCMPLGKSKKLKSQITVSTKNIKSSNKVPRFRKPNVTPSNFTDEFINIDKISKVNNKKNTKKRKKYMNETKKRWPMKAQSIKSKDKDASKSLQRCSCSLNIQNNKTPFSKVVTVKRVSIEEEPNVVQYHENNVKKSILKYKNCKHNGIDDTHYVTHNAAKYSKQRMIQEYNTNNPKDYKNINSPSKYDFAKGVCLPGKNTKHLNDHKELKPSSFWNSFKFKKILRRITNIFSRSTKSQISNLHKNQIDCTKPLVNKTTKNIKRANKSDTIKTSKSDRHPIPKAVKSLKKTNSLKLGKNIKDKSIDPVDSKRRPYSKFQSGDAGNKDLVLLKNRMKPCITCNMHDNNIICSYCHAKYDRNIKQVKAGTMAPYANENVVQLALAAPDCSIISQNNGGSICTDRGTKPSKKMYSEYKEQQRIKSVAQTELICSPADDAGKGDDITKNKDKKGKSETPKVVCETKNPCACCKGSKQAGSLLCSILFGDKTIPPPDDTPGSKSSKVPKKDKECDTICKTKPFEEKGLIMKAMENFLTPKPAKVEVCNYDPVLQMKLDSGSLNVLNRDEIFDKVRQLKITEAKDKLTAAELKRLHGDACRCCACQSMKHRKKKGVTDEKPEAKKKLSMKDKLKTQAKAMKQKSMAGLHMAPRPCICGSAPCVRASKQEYLDEMAKRKRKLQPCVCGARICKEEILKMAVKNKSMTKKAAHQAKKKMKASSKKSVKKIRKKGKKGKGGKKKKKAKGGPKKLTKEELGEMKKNLREFHLLEIHYGKVDEKRLKNQLKRENRLDKEVRHGKPDNFCILINESILDLLQVVIRIITGIFRTTFRVILHPKRTMRHLERAINSPKLAVIYVIEALENLGFLFALRRIWWRIRRSTCLLYLKEKLESCFLTYYLIHMCDRNPKKRRMRQQNTRRKRQSADFGCSIFMISIRKKPCMWCYYKFPWFYPHCISVVKLLRSLLDTLIFILAVCVWSPLLLCMECCRALMCCTMCTG